MSGVIPLIAAIVLSAGKSERMGRPKALLQFKGQTFLERILEAIRQAGVEHCLVVVGHHRDEIGSIPGIAGTVFNPDYEKGMSTSVQAGVRALPQNVTAAALFLVDHPLVRGETIRQLAECIQPGKIVLPVCDGRRGHPVILAADLFPEILAIGPDMGLNTVVRRDPSRVVEVVVLDPGVVADIDTPEQFEKLLQDSE